jgi:MFS family permease
LLLVRLITSSIIWIDFTLLFTLLSYQWRATALEVGVVTAFYGLPGLIFGPWFGVVADRTDPIRLLRRSYWVRAVSSIGLVTSPNFAVFALFVICQGLSNLGVMPSEQILIKRTLTTELMVRHARYTSIFDQVAKVAAPLAGAALSHGFGARAGYIVSAALVFPATACLHALGRIAAARRGIVSEPWGASRSLGTLFSVLRQQEGYRLGSSSFCVEEGCDNGSWSKPVDMWARRRGRLVHMPTGSGLI